MIPYIPIFSHNILIFTSPRERWRSIVMIMSMWESVCLSVRQDISGATGAIFTICCACCLWPWLGPSLAEWGNPKGRGQFWGFSSPFTAKGIGRDGGDGSAPRGWSV